MVIIAQGAGEIADGKFVGADLADRRHFGSRADNEALLETNQLLGPDHPFVDLDLAPLGKIYDRSSGDAVKKAVGHGRVQLAVLDEENVGAVHSAT
jgi:hypothetical protein